MGSQRVPLFNDHHLGVEFLPTGCEAHGVNTIIDKEVCQARVDYGRTTTECETTDCQYVPIDYIDEQFSGYGGFGICNDMDNPARRHHGCDTTVHEDANRNHVALMIEHYLQLEGGGKDNDAPIRMSKFGFCEPLAIINELVGQEILPESFIKNHSSSRGWTASSTAHKQSQEAEVARVNMLCVAIPADRFKEYKRDYRQHCKDDRNGKRYPLQCMQQVTDGPCTPDKWETRCSFARPLALPTTLWKCLGSGP